MKKTKHKITLGDEVVTIYKGSYLNGGGIAIELVCASGESFLTLTVNFHPNVSLRPGEFAIKNWSENEPYIPDIFKSGLFEDTGKHVTGGFISAPVWKFK